MALEPLLNPHESLTKFWLFYSAVCHLLVLTLGDRLVIGSAKETYRENRILQHALLRSDFF